MPREIPLAELVREAITSALSDVWTMTIGIVQTYDGESRTADIQPAIKRAIAKDSGVVTHETLPVLPNVMVLWPMSVGTANMITLPPLQKGDAGMLIFAVSAITQWRETGQVSEAGDWGRQHHLGNAVFIPGLGAKNTNHAQGAENAIVISAADLISLGSKDAPHGVGLGDIIKDYLSSIRTVFNAHTHTSGGSGDPTSGPVAPFAAVPETASAKVKVDP